LLVVVARPADPETRARRVVASSPHHLSPLGTTDLFTITRVWRADPTRGTAAQEDRFRITLDRNVPWDGSHGGAGWVHLLKFTPTPPGVSMKKVAAGGDGGEDPDASVSEYEFVAPCANRGRCDDAAGTCDCFAGYTGDDCTVLNALAI
jgi:hypothetical protein